MNKPIHTPERSLKRKARANLVRKFGINYDQYEHMLNEQMGVCAICGGIEGTGRALAVDHCHTTGRVRGLLCSDCNTAIGLLKDNKELLLSAVNYLDKEYVVPDIEDTVGHIDMDDRANWKLLVTTPDGVFPSTKHAGDFYKVNHTTIRNWCLPESKYKKDGFSCEKMYISLNDLKERIANVWNK